MTASCESPVRTYERFTVTYTLLNNLQDFLAVRLVWTPEHAQAGGCHLPGLVPWEGQEKGQEARENSSQWCQHHLAEWLQCMDGSAENLAGHPGSLMP